MERDLGHLDHSSTTLMMVVESPKRRQRERERESCRKASELPMFNEVRTGGRVKVAFGP